MRIGIDLGGSHIGVGLIEEDKILGNVKDKILTRQDRVHIEESIINDNVSKADIWILSISAVFLLLTIIFSIIYIKHQQKTKKKVSK